MCVKKILDIPVEFLTNDEVVERVKKELQTKKTFLILDNVPSNYDCVASETFLNDTLPSGVNCHVLMTSRESNWVNIRKIDLDIFSIDDSTKYLLERIGSDDEENARVLANKLGFLPLALSYAAAYIKETKISIIGYLEIYEKSLEKILTFHPRVDSYPYTISVSFEISINNLSEQEKKFLYVLSYLDPERIGVKFLKSILYGCENVDDKLNRLASLSLIKWDKDDDSVYIHRLLQSFSHQSREDLKKTIMIYILQCFEKYLLFFNTNVDIFFATDNLKQFFDFLHEANRHYQILKKLFLKKEIKDFTLGSFLFYKRQAFLKYFFFLLNNSKDINEDHLFFIFNKCFNVNKEKLEILRLKLKPITDRFICNVNKFEILMFLMDIDEYVDVINEFTFIMRNEFSEGDLFKYLLRLFYDIESLMNCEDLEMLKYKYLEDRQMERFQLSELYYDIGSLYFKKNKIEIAEYCFKKAKVLGLNDPKKLKLIYLKLKNFYLKEHAALEEQFSLEKFPIVISLYSNFEYVLGKYYEENKNIDLSIFWFSKAAQKKNESAIIQLHRFAALYKNGVGGEKNIKKSLELYMKNAELGYLDAQVVLGIIYYKDFAQFEIEQNVKEAIRWFEKSEKSSLSKYYLGNIYYNGNGVDKDVKKAIKYWEEASFLGEMSSKFSLAMCYYDGNGIEKKIAEAIKLLEELSKSGHRDAKYVLAIYYSNGNKEERIKSIKLLEQAAMFGESRSQLILVRAYSNGFIVERDVIQSVLWLCSEGMFRSVNEDGSIDFHIAMQYALGINENINSDCNPDRKEAVKWWTKSAEKNNMYAQCCLMMCYLSGWYEVEKNLKDFAIWAEKFCEHQNLGERLLSFKGFICFTLAELYSLDGVLEKDLELAKLWYQKSAEQGYGSAQEKLRELGDNVSGEVLPNQNLDIYLRSLENSFVMENVPLLRQSTEEQIEEYFQDLDRKTSV